MNKCQKTPKGQVRSKYFGKLFRKTSEKEIGLEGIKCRKFEVI
jgi:hypothetical protein